MLDAEFIAHSRTDIPLFAEALKIAMEALKVYAKGPDLRMGDDDHHIVSHENGMAGMLRFTIMMKDSDVAKDALDAIEKLGDFDHVCNGFLGVGSGGIQETEITVLIQIRDTLQQILEKMK